MRSAAGKVVKRNHGFIFKRSKMVMPHFARRWGLRRQLARKQRKGVSNAGQYGFSINRGIRQQFRPFCLDFAVEDEVESNPVRTHCRKVTSDSTVSFYDRDGLVLVLRRPTPGPLEKCLRYVLRQRAQCIEAENDARQQNESTLQDFSCASSVWRLADNSCCSNSGVRPCGKRLKSRRCSRTLADGARRSKIESPMPSNREDLMAE